MTRMQRRIGLLKGVCLAAVVLAVVTPALALPVNVIFTIESNISAESWSGTDDTYGTYSPQFTGSLTTPVAGNFVVSFDPSTDTPTSIQLVSNFSDPNNNNGYFGLQTNPGSFLPYGTPANLGGQSGPIQFAIRDLVWNFNSPVLNATSTAGLTSTYDLVYDHTIGAPQTTAFKVTAGGIDVTTASATGHSTYVNSIDNIDTGSTWTLSESAAGSGDWTLTLNGAYTYGYDTGETTGTLQASGIITSTAHYAVGTTTTAPNVNTSTGNVVDVPTPTTDPVQRKSWAGPARPAASPPTSRRRSLPARSPCNRCPASRR